MHTGFSSHQNVVCNDVASTDLLKEVQRKEPVGVVMERFLEEADIELAMSPEEDLGGGWEDIRVRGL